MSNFYIFNLWTLIQKLHGLEKVVDSLCDRTKSPDHHFISGFVAERSGEALPAIATGQLTDGSTLTIYSRDPSITALPNKTDITHLRKLMAVFTHGNDRIHVVMDSFDALESFGMFFQSPDKQWSFAHALSMPMQDYIESVMARGHVGGQEAQFRRVTMTDGTVFMLRSFWSFTESIEKMVTMFEKKPDGSIITHHMPEDHCQWLERPFDAWLSSLQKTRPALKVSEDLPISPNHRTQWRDLVGGDPYFIIYRSQNPNPMTGQYLQMRSIKTSQGMKQLPYTQDRSKSLLYPILEEHGHLLFPISRPPVSPPCVVEQIPPAP